MTKPDALAGLRGRTFATWEVIGRTRSDRKGTRVFVRCRHCGVGQRIRKRSLLTGYFKWCERCYGSDSPIARHMPPDDYDPTNPINTHTNKENP